MSNGTLTFLPGVTTQTITVTVNGDARFEAAETFFVNLSTPTNTTIADAQGIGTILNDDTDPTVSIASPAAVTEGGTITFTISLSAVSGLPTTDFYTTSNGTATGGLAGAADYDSVTGSVVIAAGSLTTTVVIQTNQDLLDEPTETFFVTLTSATSGTVDSTQNVATGQILDDDPTPTVSLVGPVTSPENVGSMMFVVQLSAVSGQDVTVNYTITPGTALAGLDYTGTGGSITILAGQPTGTILVPIVNDALNEDPENFTVTLTTATNATIGATPTALGTINDDDPMPTITVAGGQATEGPGANVVFTISLGAASGRTVTMNYTIDPGTATAADYSGPLTSTVTFAPGQTVATVNVPVVDDLLDDAVETFTLTLNTPSNATLGTTSVATGTIFDNDAAPIASVTATPATVTEGTGGTTTYTFTITLNTVSGQPVIVNY